MKLNLQRPIVFFDLETTGIDVSRDHIVELCYIKVFPNGNEEAKSMRIKPVDSLGNVVHIPEASSAIHGITDDDVKDCPSFADVAQSLLDTFADSDIAGYNSNHFDVPLLVDEFMRIGITPNFRNAHMVDVCTIFKKMEQRTLTAAYKFYCKKNLENAHSALADTRATLEVLCAQLDMYGDALKNDIGELAKFSNDRRNVDLAGRIVLNERNEEVFNFGKYRGQVVKDVLKKDPGFYSWVIESDFTLDTKQVLRAIKQRK